MQKSCCSYSVCEDFIVPVLNLSSSMYLCVCVQNLYIFCRQLNKPSYFTHVSPFYLNLHAYIHENTVHILQGIREFLHKIKILFLPFVIACCQHKTCEQLTGHSIPSGSKCGDNFHPQIWNLAASLAGILNGKMKVWASLWKLWLASFDGRVRKQYNFSGKPCTKITSNALFPYTFKTHLARLCELVNNVQTNTCRTD